MRKHTPEPLDHRPPPDDRAEARIREQYDDTATATLDYSPETAGPVLDVYRRFIEHAPPPLPAAPGLIGFVDGLGHFLCSTCSGRIMARGCSMKGPVTPVWHHSPAGGFFERLDACDLCGEGGDA